MKIRSVEIPMEDGTESTGSDTLDISLLPSSFASSSSSQHMAAAQQQEYYEQTIGSFAVALTELQMELRGKTDECEALYETARNLSFALQESDRLLQAKTLEQERLLLKLQMVTFVEQPDEEDEDAALSVLEEALYDKQQYNQNKPQDYVIPQRPAAILDEIAVKCGGTKAVAILSTGTAPLSSSMSQKDAAAGPVCVDDLEENASAAGDDFEQSLPLLKARPDDTPASPSSSSSSSSNGPRQAHFYHVILERDMALQTNKKMARELKYSRAKIRDLKAKLEKSTTLVELSYVVEAPTVESGKKATKSTTTPTIKSSKRDNNDDKALSLFPKAHQSELHRRNEVQKQPTPQPSEQQQHPKLRFDPQSRSNTLLHQLEENLAAHAKNHPATVLKQQHRNVPWLRKNGLSVRVHHRPQQSNESTVAECILDEELIGSHWNKTDDKLVAAAAEQKYLQAVSLDDADRAGGILMEF